jgi:hypothetical protein
MDALRLKWPLLSVQNNAAGWTIKLALVTKRMHLVPQRCEDSVKENQCEMPGYAVATVPKTARPAPSSDCC